MGENSLNLHGRGRILGILPRALIPPAAELGLGQNDRGLEHG